jgi:imidazolonepropionase
MFSCRDNHNGETVGVGDRVDRLWVNGRLATLRAGAPGYGSIEPGAIATRDGRIAWIGAMTDLPTGIAADETVDLDGRWVTPGLIDCHTHLVYAGDRAAEFELRLNGATYEEIAHAGGGIASTTEATRGADEAALVAAALPRLDALLAEGLTTIEIKSGYGLTPESETIMLAAARRLATLRDVTVRTTFLGAHAVPPEYAGDADGYIDLVCHEMIPRVAAAGLADAVDGFCDTIGFDRQQIRRVFEAARAHRLPVKLHAEQLSNMGGAALAAEFGALSADHLEHLDGDGADALARAGTVAVLLPGAFYFLRETRVPPVDLLRARGVPMAVATDCNPGSSPLTSVLLAMNMAATLFRLTAEEALAGTTREAARALGLADACGTLEAGKWCDLAVWDIERPAELVYRMGFNPLFRRVWRGQ